MVTPLAVAEYELAYTPADEVNQLGAVGVPSAVALAPMKAGMIERLLAVENAVGNVIDLVTEVESLPAT